MLSSYSAPMVFFGLSFCLCSEDWLLAQPVTGVTFWALVKVGQL